MAGTELTAPQMAECVPLFHVDLGDVSKLVAMGGAAPDTALAFSPDGKHLAIGSYNGEILIVDGFNGRLIRKRKLAETMIKKLLWAPNGKVLFAAEQSPDAYVHVLEVKSLENIDRIRLADLVGTSAVPPGEDLYGVYTLPAAHGLQTAADGLLVAAVHAWNTDEGRQNASRLVFINSEGQSVASWPPDGAASVTLMNPRVMGDKVAVPVGRSADGPAPDLPVNGVQLLQLPGLEPIRTFQAEPLLPHYSQVFLWETVDLGAEHLVMGATDGRVLVFPLAGGPPLTIDVGTPQILGGVPVVATLGHTALAGNTVLALTSESSIPFGAAAPDLRPPSLHPNENGLFAYGLEGTLRWTWRGAHAPQGMTISADGKTLVVGAGKRSSDDRRDLYGALVFDLTGTGSGDERLQTVCSTQGPVFFRQAVNQHGLIAVTEFPTLAADGAVTGAYQVTVFR